MRALVLINAYSDRAEMVGQAERVAGALRGLGVKTDVRRNDILLARVADGEVSVAGGYDFCVFLDKDKYSLECLERSGMRVFNPFRGITACDDKMTTIIQLSGMGFRIPRTIPGVLCYTPDAPVSMNIVEGLESELGYPMVVKESYGSLGKGVFLARDRRELLEIMERVKCEAHLFQEFVPSSAGRDLRVIVVGGRVLGGMLRESDGFRSNIACGGHGSPYEVPDDLAAESVRVAEALGLDYCGIDWLFGEDGFLLCEVNSNAFFAEFEKVTGIDVAGAYARHMVEVMDKR